MTSEARRSPADTALSVGASPAELEDFHRRLFLPLVRRAAWKHGLTKEDARDVVQEAFLLALIKLRVDGNPRAWLTRVVDHLSANFQRKAARRAHLNAKWGKTGSTATASDPEENADD